MQNGIARGTFFLRWPKNVNASNVLLHIQFSFKHIKLNIQFHWTLNIYRMLDELWGVQLIFE